MRSGNPIQSLAAALYSALLRDLPDIAHEKTIFEKGKKRADMRRETAMRRPVEDEVDVTMFAQVWASTALGYGGIGGSAMTSAYTVLVTHRDTTCVYFGYGRLAYRVCVGDWPTDRRLQWQNLVDTGSVPDKAEFARSFGSAETTRRP